MYNAVIKSWILLSITEQCPSHLVPKEIVNKDLNS